MVRYRYSPSLVQEKKLAKQIYDSLEGDVISSVLDATGAMVQRDDSLMRAGMEVTSIKVERAVMPRLYDVLYSVKDELGFDREVEFYITNSPQVNACTYMGTTPGRPLIVELNSSLVELMDEDELRFVVGHELGHQIDGNSSLNALIRFVFPNLDQGSPLLFQLKVRFWQQLCELVADRYGFLATGNLDVCVSAFFKMHSGLNLRKMDIDIKAFINHNKHLVKYYTEGQFLSLSHYDHPADSLRVEALNLYANASNAAELDEGMSQNEIDAILMTLSSYDMFPRDILDEVAGSDNVMEYFNKSVSSILELRPDDREKLFQYVIDLVLVDNKLKTEEVELMKSIGTQVFGYDEPTVMHMFAASIRASFRPAFSAIC